MASASLTLNIQSYFSRNSTNNVDLSWGSALNGRVVAGRSTDYGTNNVENFTSKIAITIPSNLPLSSSNHILLKVPLKGDSKPCGVYAYLTNKLYTHPGATQNSTYDGPSTDLTNNAITSSAPYKNSACTESYPSGWSSQISGAPNTPVYYKLSTTNLEAGATYYVYLLRNYTNDNGGSLFGAEASVGGYEATLDYDLVHYTLNINGLLDSTPSDSIAGYGTFDVYINNSRVAQGVSDYCQSHPYETTYNIKNIVALKGKTYQGVSAGNLSGSITQSTAVQLHFTTDAPKVQMFIKKNGHYYSGPVRVKHNGKWKVGSAIYMKENGHWILR